MLLPDDRDVLVVASPGTGKTWEIADTVMGLLRRGVPGDRIVCLTFTNRAALEMQKRIVGMARNDPTLLRSVYRMDIGTMHSLAFRKEDGSDLDDLVSNSLLRFIIFRKTRELRTFNYTDEYLKSDIVPKLENMIRYIKSFGIYPQDIHVQKVMEIIRDRLSGQDDDRISMEGYEKLARDFVTIYGYYEEYKSKTGKIDYNDVLHNYLIRIESPIKDYVLVDEFQDLSRDQVTLAEKIARRRFFVGDRKQSIFGFQGGSLSQFNQFISREDFNKVVKKINWRSTNNILRYSSELLESRVSDPTIRDELRDFHNPQKGPGDKVTVISADDPESSAVHILTSLLNDDVKGDFAIIVRTNAQLARLQDILSSTEIEFSSTLVMGRAAEPMGEIMHFLRGILLPEVEFLRRALFTPFSGLSFQEAVEISRRLDGGEGDEIIPPEIENLRHMKTGIEVIITAMKRIIMPMSVSLGQDYFSAASAIYSAVNDYSANVDGFSPMEFLDFLDMSVIDQEEDLRKSRVNILTVHKAKGQEFDNVIYVPSNTSGRLKFLDLLSYSIIMAATGMDVESDIRDEPYRIDYVAMTRAREKLLVVARARNWMDYCINQQICEVQEDHTGSESGVKRKYDLAYSRFLNGRRDDAQTIIMADRAWLRETITRYFSNLTEISPSLLKKIGSPWDFLSENILGIRTQSPMAKAGTDFHRFAELYTTGRLEIEKMSDETARMGNAIDQILSNIPETYARIPSQTEKKIVIPLGYFMESDEVPDDMVMKGTIDAIFSSTDGSSHLILDYKTGRDMNSEYWQQLWTYCRLFELSSGIEQSSIRAAIAYVNLRGPVNTEKSELKLLIRDFSDLSRQSRTVVSAIRNVVKFREDPQMFIEYLMAKKPRNDLENHLADLIR